MSSKTKENTNIEMASKEFIQKISKIKIGYGKPKNGLRFLKTETKRKQNK